MSAGQTPPPRRVQRKFDHLDQGDAAMEAYRAMSEAKKQHGVYSAEAHGPPQQSYDAGRRLEQQRDASERFQRIQHGVGARPPL